MIQGFSKFFGKPRDWIDFEIDTSLPSPDVIRNAVAVRSVAIDEFAFVLHLIKAETSDIHIGSIVDARTQVIHQVLHNIRITEWSSDKPTTACKGLIQVFLFVVSLSNKPSHDSLGHFL